MNYDRRFEILVNGVPFIPATAGRQFSVQFDITHDFGGYNSYADISIRNLSDATSGRVLTAGAEITFKAGYVDNYDQIFKGTIKNAIRSRPEQATTATRLICVGGSLSDRRSKVTGQFGPGVKLVDILNAIAQAMDLSLLITASDFADVPPYSGGYMLNGDPLTYLNRLAYAHAFRFTTDGAALVIVKDGSFRPGAVTKVSQFTGMEGIPEITEIGADVVTRLNPQVQIGGRFQIDSRYKNFAYSNLYFQNVPESAGQGVYNILQVQHSGDSTGDRWSTKLTGIR